MVCYKVFLFVALTVQVNLAEAGIVVGGTRLIYDGGKKESSISVSNLDQKAYLIQSWVDTQNNGIEKSPFIVVPPLFRLEGKQQNSLRVIRNDGAIPASYESLYWLNIKSIAAENKNNQNKLQIAVKTRIKLIYRPKSLRGRPEDMASKLIWDHSGNQLKVSNPTPFVMNLQQIKVGSYAVENVTYVLPMGQRTFNLPSGTTGTIRWRLISDFGGVGAEHSSGPK